MVRMDRDQIIQHIPRLRRYARLLTGDVHRADDLVQDTLERACVKWVLWQPRVALAGQVQTEPLLQLRAWLFTVMHNLFINQLRGKHGGRDSVQLDDVELESIGRDPGLRMDIERGLAQLPADQREVLLLVALEDFSYAEAVVLHGRKEGGAAAGVARGHAGAILDQVWHGSVVAARGGVDQRGIARRLRECKAARQ